MQSIMNASLECHTDWFHYPKNLLCFSYSKSDLVINPIVSCFPESHINWTMKYVAFSYWLLSLSDMHLMFIQAIWINTPKWLEYSFYSLLFHCIHVPQFPVSPLKDILVASSLGSITSKAAVSFTCRFLYGYMFSDLLGKYLVAQFLDPMLRLCLRFTRNCRAVF